MTNKLTQLIHNEKLVRISNKFFALVSVGFPGGYKFFVILLITTFASSSVANDFSKLFFWVALLYTFSGLPIVTLLVSSQYVITVRDQLLLVSTSSLIGYFIAYYIALNQYNASVNICIFISVLCLSAYEVIKRHFLNVGNFKPVFIASCFTMIITLILGVILFKFNNSGLLLFSCFLSLLLPMLFFHRAESTKLTPSTISNITINFIKYALSNATSTSLMYAVPIVIVAEVGDYIAAELAMVFYFSTLTYLIPHVLSAKHIPNMRKNGVSSADVSDFFISILKFIVITILIALPTLYYFYDQWLIFFILFSAMQVSQLSLPFSNILMVKGLAGTLLKINIISTSTLLVFIAIIFYETPPSPYRIELLLLTFLGLQFIKLYLGYLFSKNIIGRSQVSI
ncbi:hypothetical protein KO495_02765 [Colwellia sp. D2M02]|uniref:hypothetical protein n=1 Tax=Colwellia sp. D2M02 TaxID=2841562 RepID=UPI001C0A5EE1|nr:hypothetical protein [Colwellia sp. D2M02]MBU2892242.1 hypothetical protein [Colwellia sp. D2M02]